MHELCEKYGMKHKFITAFDGNGLPAIKLNEFYSKNKALAVMGRELSSGEIGCLLSHRNIYKKIVSENIPYALVLEDDIDFDEDAIQVLKNVEELPNDWECILLGHYSCHGSTIRTKTSIWHSKAITSKFFAVRLGEVACGTHGYLINKSGAQKLLKQIVPAHRPIDHFTGNERYINVYAISPPCIHTHESLSEKSSLKHEREDAYPSHQKGWLNKILSPDSYKRFIKHKIKMVIRIISPIIYRRKYHKKRINS